MKKYTNQYGRECWDDVTQDSEFKNDLFHLVAPWEDQIQWALHTNLGSITVVDRMTGFGWRDVETGYRDMDGNFWLASGHCDVRNSGSKTIGEAIDWIKRHANTCNPDRVSED